MQAWSIWAGGRNHTNAYKARWESSSDGGVAAVAAVLGSVVTAKAAAVVLKGREIGGVVRREDAVERWLV